LACAKKMKRVRSCGEQSPYLCIEQKRASLTLRQAKKGRKKEKSRYIQSNDGMREKPLKISLRPRNGICDDFCRHTNLGEGGKYPKKRSKRKKKGMV